MTSVFTFKLEGFVKLANIKIKKTFIIAKVVRIFRVGKRLNMTIYISLDGDDIGNKIARSYLENDEIKLTTIVKELEMILIRICEYLKSSGFEIIFCAADGIACKGSKIEVSSFTKYIESVGKPHYTFSAGIGSDLQSSFYSLRYAKSMGKNKVVICENGKQFTVINLNG
jgi:hypothetical protein